MNSMHTVAGYYRHEIGIGRYKLHGIRVRDPRGDIRVISGSQWNKEHGYLEVVLQDPIYANTHTPSDGGRYFEVFQGDTVTPQPSDPKAEARAAWDVEMLYPVTKVTGSPENPYADLAAGLRPD